MKLSLKNKLSIMILATTLILSVLFVMLFSFVGNRFITSTYKDRALDLAQSVAEIVDTDKLLVVKDAVLDIYDDSSEKILSSEWGSDAFNTYTAQFESVEELPEYQDLLNDLTALKDINHVESLYICGLDTEYGLAIYLVDASDDPCPPGCLDVLLVENKALLTDPSVGFPPYSSDMFPYGSLVTAGVPIYADDSICGYAMVDISLDAIRHESLLYTVIISVVLVLIGTAAAFLIAMYLRKHVIVPIVTLSSAAANYQYAESDQKSHVFKDVEIKTGDEIEVLLDSMKVMENNMNAHIEKLMGARFDLDAVRAQAIRADEQARKDSLTGIRNRTAFDEMAHKIDWEMDGYSAKDLGIAMIDLNYLKRINDNFGHDKGNLAIVTLCQIVCRTFSHSPVFRLGGDEFVVILRGEDFSNRHKLVQMFRDRLNELQEDESLEIWEKPSAAIGMAIYDPKIDKNTANLLKRADEVMRKEKRAMEAAREE